MPNHVMPGAKSTDASAHADEARVMTTPALREPLHPGPGL
jgi:hypothetical protein